MTFAVLLGLITLIGWGTGDLFTIVLSRKMGANLTSFWVFLGSFILSAGLLHFMPHDLSGLTIPLLLLNVFLGVLYVLGNVLISEAFRTSSAPLVGIIVQAFPAVVLLLSAVVFKDVITLSQLGFIAVIFLGVTLCSVDFAQLKQLDRVFNKGTVLAILAMICVSIFFTFSRPLITAYGWFLPSFIANACFPLIYIFMKLRKEKLVIPHEPKMIIFIILGGFLIKAADFALNYGLTLPNASSIVAPIAGAAPILFVIMSYFIFKDKLTKQQMIGIVTTLAGIVLLVVRG